ncbi:MAG: hypothetical protein JW940_04825 [Polyangiaceae bacterium]|nr:hypothetical protein [Polyangiaceae bacterium]
MPTRIPCTKCGTPLAISRELLDAVQGHDAKILCHECGAPTSLDRPAPVVPKHEQGSPEADEEFYDRPTLRVEPEALASELSRGSEPPLGSDPDNRITLAYVSAPTPSGGEPGHGDVHEPAATSRRAQVVTCPSSRPPAEEPKSGPGKWLLLVFAASVAAWCVFEGTSSRSEGPAVTRTPSEAVATAAKPAGSAAGEPPSAVARTSAPPAERTTDRPFDGDAARASLNEAALAAATCRTRGDPPGTTEVVVTFDPSGQARSARIYTGIYLHTHTARCVEKKMLEARVPAFSGDSVVLHHPIVVY